MLCGHSYGANTQRKKYKSVPRVVVGEREYIYGCTVACEAWQVIRGEMSDCDRGMSDHRIMRETTGRHVLHWFTFQLSLSTIPNWQTTSTQYTYMDTAD